MSQIKIKFYVNVCVYNPKFTTTTVILGKILKTLNSSMKSTGETFALLGGCIATNATLYAGYNLLNSACVYVYVCVMDVTSPN